MYKTESEIFSQYEALKKTYDYILANSDKIRQLADLSKYASLTFIGCGSSYSLCKSVGLSVKLRTGKQVNVLAAGDLMLNFDIYRNLLKDTLLVVPSRSGNTSEVILAIKRAKEMLNTSCISICSMRNADISKLADLNMEIPWAFDESVCQTRTVTNLYLANLIFAGIISGDDDLIRELGEAIEKGKGFIEEYSPLLKDISGKDSWNKVVVLSDAELEGIAEEGALAFNEICQLHSNYYHVLDVRHGPMVLIDKKTLVIVAASPLDVSYQSDLISDIRKKGALVVSVTNKAENVLGADYNVTVPSYKNYAVAGIPFIFVPQALSYYKALAAGVNPDEPQGLNAWITL